jgi:hypothetical protein
MRPPIGLSRLSTEIAAGCPRILLWPPSRSSALIVRIVLQERFRRDL